MSFEDIGATPDLISVTPTSGLSGDTQFKFAYTLSNLPILQNTPSSSTTDSSTDNNSSGNNKNNI